jgi:tight adherence protein B
MGILLWVLIGVNVIGFVVSRVLKSRPVPVDGDSAAAAQSAMARNKQEKFEFLSRFVRGRKGASVIERDLVTAGLVLRPTEFLMINLGFLCLMLLFGLWHISRMPAYGSFFELLKRVLWFALYVGIGWKLPRMILHFLAGRRRGVLEVQLADALAIVSSGLKGGYSFIQGIDMASQQLEPPLSDEFARVLRLVQLGMDTPRALLQLAERVNSYDYDMMVSATNIQLSVGGNLSNLLENVATTIRDRIRLRRDIAVLTAQGRMSGAILIALPVGIAIMLKVVNPVYMAFLFDEEMGNNLLYMALGQQLVGIYWIKKLLDFDN